MYQRLSASRCHSYAVAPLKLTRTAKASSAAGSIARSVTVARPATMGGATVGAAGGDAPYGWESGVAPGGVPASGGGVGGAVCASGPCASKTTVNASGPSPGMMRWVAPRTPSMVSVVVGTRAEPTTATSISSTAVPAPRRAGASDDPKPVNEICTRSGDSALVVVTSGIAPRTVTKVRFASERTSSIPIRGCNTVSPAAWTGSTYSARASAKNGSTTSEPSAVGANGAWALTPAIVYAGSPTVKTIVRWS